MEKITRETTIREIIAKYPKLVDVLELKGIFCYR